MIFWSLVISTFPKKRRGRAFLQRAVLPLEGPLTRLSPNRSTPGLGFHLSFTTLSVRSSPDFYR
jgi:hypothetical protein